MIIAKAAAMNESEVKKRMSRYADILSDAHYISRAVRDICDECALSDMDIQLKSSYSGMLYITVIAPALIGYVEWVLEMAVKTGKDRIYFLSRDGWQMYLIAKKMVQARRLPVECRYLNVSRYSMKLPAYHLDIEKSIDSICVGGIDVTSDRILKRAGLTDEECRKVLEDAGVLQDSHRILNYQEIIGLRQKLIDNERIRKLIYVHSAAAYDTAVNYLIQEGLCRDGNYYIADSGWIGTLQCAIQKLVDSVRPDIEVEGCYFGMYEFPKNAAKEKFHTYYFSPERGLKRKCAFSNSLFETIVSSDEGMTTGYQNAGDEYIPVKSDSRNPNFLMIRNNISLLEKMLDAMPLDKCDMPLIDRQTIYRLFRLFMAEPACLEVNAYGDNKFSDNVLDDGCKSVAAQLDTEQIKNLRFMSKLMIITGIKKAQLRESAWIEGSTVRAFGDDTRKRKREFRHIRLYKRFIYLRKQMKA